MVTPFSPEWRKEKLELLEIVFHIYVDTMKAVFFAPYIELKNEINYLLNKKKKKERK